MNKKVEQVLRAKPGFSSFKGHVHCPCSSVAKQRGPYFTHAFLNENILVYTEHLTI